VAHGAVVRVLRADAGEEDQLGWPRDGRGFRERAGGELVVGVVLLLELLGGRGVVAKPAINRAASVRRVNIKYSWLVLVLSGRSPKQAPCHPPDPSRRAPAFTRGGFPRMRV